MPSSINAILLIEPNLNGHRSIYLSKIADFFCKTGKMVIIATSANQKITPQIEKVVSDNSNVVLQYCGMKENINLIGGNFVKNIKREIFYWVEFRKIYKKFESKYRIDAVFLPYIDYVMYAIGLLGSPFGNAGVSGICMRPTFHFKSMGVKAPAERGGVIKEFLFVNALKNNKLKKIYPIDFLLPQYIEKKYKNFSKKVDYFPDPSDFEGNWSRDDARAKLGVLYNERILLVYGFLDNRKNIRQLFDLLNKVSPEKWPKIIFAGVQSAEIEELVLSMKKYNAEKIIIINKFINNNEEQMLFSACDAVWCVYCNHYTMSGVVIKAIQSGTNFITAKYGLMAVYAEKYNGYIWNNDFSCIESALNGTKRNAMMDFHSWNLSLNRLRII